MIDHVHFILSHGGGKARDTGIASGPCHRTEAVAHFLLYLGRTQVPFSLVVSKGNTRLKGKGQNGLPVQDQPFQQVSSLTALGAARTAVGLEKDQCREFILVSLLAKLIVLGQPLRLVCRRNGTAAGGLIGFQQVAVQRTRPGASLVDERLQLPQQMCPAQAVTAFAGGKVGGPAIVDDPVAAVFEHALLGAQGELPPVGVYEQVGVLRRASHVQPVELASKADASLVEMTDRSLGQLRFNLLLDGRQPLEGNRLGGGQRGGVVGVARQIAPQSAHFGERNSVVHIEQDALGLNPGPILDRGRYMGRELAGLHTATGALVSDELVGAARAVPRSTAGAGAGQRPAGWPQDGPLP